MLNQDNYSHPVSELLNHGPVTTGASDDWFDYVGHYGLTQADIPSLIRLVENADIDDKQPNQADAPIHACRALGQIGDAAAGIYLVELLDDIKKHKLIENVLATLGRLGPNSLALLKQYFESSEAPEDSQIEVAANFCIFAQRLPLYRDECVAFLTQTLSNCSQQPAMLNGFLVYNLIELKATEAAELVEQAFQTGHVDEAISGGWPDVKIQLGLANATDFAPEALIYAGELYPV